MLYKIVRIEGERDLHYEVRNYALKEVQFLLSFCPNFNRDSKNNHQLN